MGKGVLPQRAEKVSAELLGAEHRVLEGRQAGSFFKMGERASPESPQGLIGQQLPEYAGVG